MQSRKGGVLQEQLLYKDKNEDMELGWIGYCMELVQEWEMLEMLAYTHLEFEPKEVPICSYFAMFCEHLCIISFCIIPHAKPLQCTIKPPHSLKATHHLVKSHLE